MPMRMGTGRLKHITPLDEILLESFSKNKIESVVKKVYPQIVKDLGGNAKKVEVHNNIYDRLGAVAAEDLMKENNPSAEFDPDTQRIYIYSSAVKDVEMIIRALLHEHTHTLQDQKKFKKLYDEGYQYDNHPFEIEATKAEKNWKKYI